MSLLYPIEHCAKAAMSRPSFCNRLLQSVTKSGKKVIGQYHPSNCEAETFALKSQVRHGFDRRNFAALPLMVQSSIKQSWTSLIQPSNVISTISIWLSSTLKKRKAKMNKHKLRKRRKKLRLKSRK